MSLRLDPPFLMDACAAPQASRGTARALAFAWAVKPAFVGLLAIGIAIAFPFAFAISLALSSPAHAQAPQAETAQEVHVAVAANFARPMQEIAAAFTQASGQRVTLSLGSTGKFYAQITHGAPYHVLLAADSATPKRLEAEGLAVPGSRFTYATGRLALWSKQAALVDAQGAVLRSRNFTRLAIANPKLAPYGQAAQQTLEKLGLLVALQGRLVQGDDIAQTYQFVSTGNAELGFVALSQVMQDGVLREGSAWIVPASLHSPITQDAVLLNAGRNHAAALALLQFMQSPTARSIMRKYAYD